MAELNMANDTLTEVLGGQGTVEAWFYLFLLLSIVPGLWSTFWGMVAAVVGFSFKLVMRLAEDLVWFGWTKPRLERKMWTYEAENRIFLGTGSPVPKNRR
jgi:hypothetical protein